jgi:hypothetical protein
MRGAMRAWARRLLICGASTLAAGGLAIVAALSFPQPLYAHHLQHAGLELWSDQPFDAEDGAKLLRDVRERLDRSPFAAPKDIRRIFIANAPWRERLFFLWNRGAAGVAYWPVTSNVFLRHSDIAADRLYGPGGRRAEAPRTLAYYVAHEIGHGLSGARAGAWTFARMPRWVREGVADYIAFGPGSAKAIAAALRPDDPRLSPERSGYYLRYHLMVACALENGEVTIDALLRLGLSQGQAAARWLEDEAPGRQARACRNGKTASFSVRMDEAST